MSHKKETQNYCFESTVDQLTKMKVNGLEGWDN